MNVTGKALPHEGASQTKTWNLVWFPPAEHCTTLAEALETALVAEFLEREL